MYRNGQTYQFDKENEKQLPCMIIVREGNEVEKLKSGRELQAASQPCAELVVKLQIFTKFNKNSMTTW
jgi:hypothetical protein